MANLQEGQQATNHRGIFELYIPAATHCPCCRRAYSAGERRSSYAGVEICVGCAAKQDAADVAEKLEALRSQVRDIAFRELI